MRLPAVLFSSALLFSPIAGWGASQDKPKPRSKAKAHHKFRVADKRDVENLVKAAHFGLPEERERALTLLADPNPKAKRKLESSYVALLDDPETDLRSSAARALGKLGSTAAVPKLKEILASIPKNKYRGNSDMNEETEDEYRQAYPVAQALMELGDFDSAKEILDRPVLSETWEALLPRLGEKVIPLLEEKTKSDNPAVRNSAERALAATRWHSDTETPAASTSPTPSTP